MEKSVNDYATARASSAFGDDIPPPAYKTTFPNSVRLTRIISTTVVALTLAIGVFFLLGLYIQTRASSCHCDTPQGYAAAQVRRLDDSYEPLTAMASKESQKKVTLPLSLQMDDDTGRLVKGNKKAHVNCIVEKKRATQIISNRPKLLVTPYGNITTDPGVVQMVGEKMIFSCHSGMKKMPPKMEKGDSEIGSRRRRAVGTCDCDCAC